MFVLAFLACVQPRSARADTISDFEDVRNNQQRNQQAAIKLMPRVDAHNLQDVLRMRMEHGNLVVHTPLPTTKTNGYARLDLAESTMPFLVRVVGAKGVAGASEPGVPTEFLLQHVDYSRPQLISNLSLSQAQSTMLTIVQADSVPGGSRNVQFIWQRNPLLPGGGVAQLAVNENGFKAGGPPVNLNISEPDCATLFRRHADATEKYLRPILIALGQENVFAPDSLVAQQVFPENVKANDELVQRVERLLPDLDADDYHRRDRATADLQAIGSDLPAAVMHLNRARLTPEQNLRLDRVLAPLGMVSVAEAKRLRHDLNFLLNCLYTDDLATRRAALEQLRQLTSEPIEIDADAPSAVRAEAVRTLRKKLLHIGS